MKNIVQYHYQSILERHVANPTSFLKYHIKGTKASSSCSVETLMRHCPKVPLKDIPERYRLYTEGAALMALTWESVVQNTKPTKRVISGWIKDAKTLHLLPMYQFLNKEWLTAIITMLESTNDYEKHPYISYYAQKAGLDVPIIPLEEYDLGTQHIGWLIHSDLPEEWNGCHILEYMHKRQEHYVFDDNVNGNLMAIRLLTGALEAHDTIMLIKTLRYLCDNLKTLNQELKIFEWLKHTQSYVFQQRYETKDLVNNAFFMEVTTGCHMLHEFLGEDKHHETLHHYLALGIPLSHILLEPFIPKEYTIKEESLYL